MTAPEIIRAAFGDAACGSPAGEEEIARAERLLGARFPAELRLLYAAFDGFRGPTGARFMWPLFAKDGLVDTNRFLREGSGFPRGFVASCLFVGDAGIGDMWGFKRDLPNQVIRWSASWGADFEVAGASLVEAWLREKECYDDSAKQG